MSELYNDTISVVSYESDIESKASNPTPIIPNKPQFEYNAIPNKKKDYMVSMKIASLEYSSLDDYYRSILSDNMTDMYISFTLPPLPSGFIWKKGFVSKLLEVTVYPQSYKTPIISFNEDNLFLYMMIYSPSIKKDTIKEILFNYDLETRKKKSRKPLKLVIPLMTDYFHQGAILGTTKLMTVVVEMSDINYLCEREKGVEKEKNKKLVLRKDKMDVKLYYNAHFNMDFSCDNGIVKSLLRRPLILKHKLNKEKDFDIDLPQGIALSDMIIYLPGQDYRTIEKIDWCFSEGDMILSTSGDDTLNIFKKINKYTKDIRTKNIYYLTKNCNDIFGIYKPGDDMINVKMKFNKKVKGDIIIIAHEVLGITYNANSITATDSYSVQMIDQDSFKAYKMISDLTSSESRMSFDIIREYKEDSECDSSSDSDDYLSDIDI